MTNTMIAPSPGQTFTGNPSGTIYKADANSIIANVKGADVAVLIEANCSLLSPSPTQSLTTVFSTDQIVLIRGGVQYLASVGAEIAEATVPAAPTVTLTPGNGQITVNIADGSANGSAITAHNLYRGTAAGGEALIGTITTGSPYLDTGLTNGTTYYYKISAVNAVGEGAQSAEVSTAPLLPLRNIASNARVGGNGYGQFGPANGTDTTTNAKTSHWNESGVALSFIKVVYNGWGVMSNAFTNGEMACPNNYNVTASIEYPAGTFTQIKFGGNAQGTVIAGTDLASDACTIALPAGANFFIHTFTSVTSAGQKWPVCSNIWNSVGELAESGVGLADKTMSGTITNTNALTNRPAAILGSAAGMKNCSLVVMGDSICAGSGDGQADAHGNTGFLARSATGVCPVVSMAVAGTTAAQQANSGAMTLRKSFLQTIGATHVITEYGVNDLSTSNSATVMASQLAIWNNINATGAKAIQTTITPEVITTDGYLTLAGMSTANAAIFQGTGSTRGLVNANIRNLPSPLFAYIEVADAAETSRNSGIFKTGAVSNATHLGATDTGVVGAGSTATVIDPSSVSTARAANYYNYGGALEFTSGSQNGVYAPIASSTNNSAAITLNTALAAAPAVGDTFNAIPHNAIFTGDGTHPINTGNLPSGNAAGGVFILVDATSPTIASWT